MDLFLRLSMCFFLLVTLSTNTQQNRRFRRQGNNINIGASCTTPRNVAGVCINILQCSLHVDYLKYKRNEPGMLKYLQDAVCGKQGSNVYTCCPQEKSGECQTPRKVAGNCISMRQCPELRNMLERYKEPGVTEYLRASQCGINKGDPLVCCPKAASSKPFLPPTNGQLGGGGDSLPGIDVCGISNIVVNKVVNGKPASLGAWPWMVALGYSSPTVALSWKCGGSLITNRYVVTAAHCVANFKTMKLVMARVGDLDLNDEVDDRATPIDIPIERTITHENYNADAHTFDIALVKLSKRVQFTDLIRPICLPTKNLFEVDMTGYSPFIAGWGATRYKGPSRTDLQEAQIDITDTDECAEAYKNIRGATVDSRVLCAQSVLGKDACQGDSGGPLMLPADSGTTYNFYLIGVVSYGYKCAEPGYPGVYTRVELYTDWIKKNIS